MAESIVQVTEGSGKKLHTISYTVGANTVEDEVVVPGPNYSATYNLPGNGTAIAVANDHTLCLNAGASLKVRVHRIRVEQNANATTGAAAVFQLLRTITGAPTGGTAITPASFDTSDAAAGAAGRSLPTVKGTESTILAQFVVVMRQTVAAAGAQVDDAWEWTEWGHGKPLIVPAGTTNGLVIKCLSAIAGATVNTIMEFTETAF